MRDDTATSRSYAPPTKAEIDACLLGFYFGFDRPFLDLAIDRAYRDLNRTLHGFAKQPDRVRVRRSAGECVRGAMTRLDAACESQETFDEWHEKACSQVIKRYRQFGFAAFTVGHAQKWINMTVKYLALFDERDQQWRLRLLQLGHMPIDSIILDRLRVEGLPRDLRPAAWSRIASYADYMGIQTWVREHFPGSAPLVVEFHLWHPATSTAAHDTTTTGT